MIEEQEEKNQITCFFCSQSVLNLGTHITSCHALQGVEIIDKPTYFKIGTEMNICKSCSKCLNNFDWLKHRKAQTCKRRNLNEFIKIPMMTKFEHHSEKIQCDKMSLSRKNESEGSKQKIINQSSEILKNWSLSCPPENHNDLLYQQVRKNQLGELAKVIILAYVDDWLKANSDVSYSVLSSILNHQISDFAFDFFNKKLKIPSFAELRNICKIDWKYFLDDKEENLLNNTFISAQLEKMQSKQKIKYTKSFNKVAEKYKDIMKKRECQNIDYTPRVEQIVRFSTYIKLIQKCLCSERKTMVHIGLDIYIILLSAQRFGSDRLRMETSLKQMLEKEDLKSAYHLRIGKTAQHKTVHLNQQLMLLLKEFKWNGFHKKTPEIIARMTEWFGIRGYAIKNSVMDYACFFETQMKLAQELAGHSKQSLNVTKNYTKASIFGSIRQMVSSVCIPGLLEKFIYQSEDSVYKTLAKRQNNIIQYSEPKQNWWQLLLEKVYRTNYKKRFLDDEQIIFGRNQEILQIMNEENIITQEILCPIKNQMMVLNEQKAIITEQPAKQMVEELAELAEEFSEQPVWKSSQKITLTINGMQLSWKNKFFFQEFYSKKISAKKYLCSRCQEVILIKQKIFQCPYCLAITHQKCTKLLCNCFESTIFLHYPVLSENKYLQLDLKLKLPSQYQKFQTQAEETIKFILACRKLRYTRVAVLSPGLNVNFKQNYEKSIRKINIANFETYTNGTYMPPIAAMPLLNYVPDKQHGTQFGLFATQKIDSFVFIGQYACDLMQVDDLILSKKLDSVMKYVMEDDIYLAPRDYCGYIPLMNSGGSAESKNNCKSITAIVNQAVRILIYTSKVIQKGSQLLYSYGKDFSYQ